MALGDILLHLMVDETSFILVIRVEPYLTVGVGGFNRFVDRGWTWGENVFSRDIVE